MVEQNEVCEVFQLGKQSRLPFTANKAWRATDKLHLVHTNVCRPMKMPSLNDNMFFILFIDDSSRCCWVNFFETQVGSASSFWKFKAIVENQSCCKLMIIRSDNGSEYSSKMFEKFCDEDGIEHQLTNTYSPQQNGVYERKNRTMVDMARYLMFEKKLPKKAFG